MKRLLFWSPLRSLSGWAVLMLLTSRAFAVDPTEARDPNEIRLEPLFGAVDAAEQEVLRQDHAWQAFEDANPKWRAIMHPATGLPHRAYGPALAFDGAEDFGAEVLTRFGIDAEAISWRQVETPGKHDWVFADQIIDGLTVFGGRLTTKWLGEELVMWGADWYRDAEIPTGQWLAEDELMAAASEGLDLDEWGPLETGEPLLVPTLEGMKLVATFVVTGRVGAVPRRYSTWVDVHSGEILRRINEVKHIDGRIAMPATDDRPERVVRRMGIDAPVMVVSGSLSANIHEMYPYENDVEAVLPHLRLPFSGGTINTDADGGFISNATGPLNLNVELRGRFSRVYTNGTTPSVSVNFEEGYNDLVLNNLGNLKERSAYVNVSLIHDHMKQWLPNFTGLDNDLTTNVDVEGECNAFYDGSSVNFFDAGGGCNPTSLIADVVWHEYGHGINDKYYQSLGGFFQNGAMNEGYADFWAMSLGDIAEIGKGFYQDSEDGIRVYDEEPKVYPEDLVGEVHADGEIICGAWYDTHLLMGGDWDLTLGLYVDAFSGMQALAANGEEGQAYTDVLLDLLQADDDDGDISNGTPNGAAIIEGFAIHGITVFSYANIVHAPQQFADADLALEIDGITDIQFPFSLYLDGVYMWYHTSEGAPFEEVLMENASGNTYTATLPAQSPGTVIGYYLGIRDTFGGISAVAPFAANKATNANIPYYTLVGVEPVMVNDSDDYSDFGVWTTGLPGEDTATTGEWEEAIPVGSYSDPADFSTICAPVTDHTPGAGGYAFITGQNPAVDAGIGANDVDAGHTTLLSPVIDLTEYENPVMAYWRWYTNAPPTGANPASDWWQVSLSNDGGETWQYLENTLQQDISWRRKAFRIADVIEPTAEFRMRFVASDSTTIGEYLDGGSLVEAALDDIVLYDLAQPESVVETAGAVLTAFPNPLRTGDRLTSRGWMPRSVWRVVDGLGREVATGQASLAGEIYWTPKTDFSEGVYHLVGTAAAENPAALTFEVQ